MALEPQPLDQASGTANAYFSPKPVALGSLGLFVPDPPVTGTYVLKSTNGVITWEVSV